MATADKYVNLSVNRILGVDRFKANFLDYLRAYDQDIVASVFASSGVFNALGLAADGNDKFKITGFTGKGIVGLDGAGNFLDLDARSADFETVQFENAGAVDYHVGLKGEVLPESLAVSPVDGLPHWDKMEEIAGWEGVPDSVADNGDGTMTLKVNAVTESGPNRSGAGRQVAVYKKTIEKSAVTYAKALEVCTVAWDATDNKITTTTWATGGAGVFGQDTPSTTASDYTVMLIGPRVSRNTDLSTVAAWCYVGFVTGAGAGNPPAVFDVTGQNVMNIPLSDFTQITRYESVPPDRLKVDVKALAGESGVDQIRVTKLGTGVTFSVDEVGNTLAGTLLLDHTDPKIDIANSDAGVDQKNWRWGTGAESLVLISYDDAWANSMTAIQIIKDAGGVNPYRIENIVIWADDFISLTAGEIRVTDLVSSGHVVPSIDVGGNLGSWVWGVTDTGYRWANLLAAEVAAIKSSEPSVYLRKTGIAADEKTWRFYIDAGDDLVLETMTDVPVSGVALMKFVRAVGTAVTHVDFNIGLHTQGITPLLQHFYMVGGYGDEFASIYSRDFLASADAPRYILRENDQIGAGVDRENWGIIAVGGDLHIGAYNSLNTLMDIGIELVRAAGDSYTVAAIHLGADTIPDTDDSFDLGAIAPGNLRWQHGYFSKDIFARQLVAEGDSGGAANKTTFTNATAAAAAGDSQVYAGGNTNAGFIKIYVGGAIAYVPYWTLIV